MIEGMSDTDSRMMDEQMDDETGRWDEGQL